MKKPKFTGRSGRYRVNPLRKKKHQELIDFCRIKYIYKNQLFEQMVFDFVDQYE